MRARTTAENRIRESLRIRRLAAFQDTPLALGTASFRKEWSNSDAMNSPVNNSTKSLVYQCLENYKQLPRQKIQKIVFRCSFSYYRSQLQISANPRRGAFTKDG